MTESMATTAEDTVLSPPAIAAGTSVVTARCSAYGIEVAVDTSDDLFGYLPSPLIPPSTMRESRTRQRIGFAFTQTRCADGPPLFTVAEEGVQVLSSSDAELAARVLESQIHLKVAALTDQAVFVHAGVVGLDGRALVIPGPSRSGKSTLVDALVSAGATYYSDEYAVIDVDGRIHAFPRELRLRDGLARDRRVSLGGEPTEPLEAAWVFNLRYQAGAVWEPKELTPGQTLLTLLANSVAVRRRSEVTVRTLRLATAPAQGWYSLRADAAETAKQILQLINRTPGATQARSQGHAGEDRP